MIPTDLLPLMSTAKLRRQRVVALDCAALVGPGGPFFIEGVLHCRLADLDAAFMAEHQPGLLILPLFLAGHDVTTAIELVQSLGYAGGIAVLAPNLPKPGLVEGELRALGPGDRLTLISP